MSKGVAVLPRLGRFAVPGILALSVLALGACGGDDGSGPEDGDVVEAFLESVSAEGAEVDVVGGAAPDASGGPEVDATLTGGFINGGTTGLVISGESFDGLVVALGGVDGYVDVDYGSGRSSADIAITLRGDLPDNQFNLRIAGRQGSTVGQYVSIPVAVVGVGSGNIQVSVSWDTPTDVDLHVIDPTGEEIYFGNDFGANGGELDLDSNAGCSIDNVNNENITWSEDETPPSGTYTVLVHYWSNCNQGTTNYIVTVRVEGEPTETFAGTLVEEDELDTVTTFTW